MLFLIFFAVVTGMMFFYSSLFLCVVKGEAGTAYSLRVFRGFVWSMRSPRLSAVESPNGSVFMRESSLSLGLC